MEDLFKEKENKTYRFKKKKKKHLRGMEAVVQTPASKYLPSSEKAETGWII